MSENGQKEVQGEGEGEGEFSRERVEERTLPDPLTINLTGTSVAGESE